MSLGPLMCRTLDHLLCPAETAALTRSVLCGAGPQPGVSCWKAHQGPTRNPRHRSRTHRAAVLVRLTAAHDIICFYKGLRGCRVQRGAVKVNLSNRNKPVLEFWLLLRVSRNSKAQIHLSCTAVSDRRLPGVETLIGEVHFLSLVRCKTRPRRPQSPFRRLFVLVPTLPPTTGDPDLNCFQLLGDVRFLSSGLVEIRDTIFRPNSKQVQNNKCFCCSKRNTYFNRFILQGKKPPLRAPI